jgi:hypothetical protein
VPAALVKGVRGSWSPSLPAHRWPRRKPYLPKRTTEIRRFLSPQRRHNGLELHACPRREALRIRRHSTRAIARWRLLVLAALGAVSTIAPVGVGPNLPQLDLTGFKLSEPEPDDAPLTDDSGRRRTAPASARQDDPALACASRRSRRARPSQRTSTASSTSICRRQPTRCSSSMRGRRPARPPRPATWSRGLREPPPALWGER